VLDAGEEKMTDLVLRKIAMLHDNIHVGNASRNRPGRVCDVWRLALDVQIDTL
jgi:hypothetical protein